MIKSFWQLCGNPRANIWGGQRWCNFSPNTMGQDTSINSLLPTDYPPPNENNKTPSIILDNHQNFYQRMKKRCTDLNLMTIVSSSPPRQIPCLSHTAIKRRQRFLWTPERPAGWGVVIVITLCFTLSSLSKRVLELHCRLSLYYYTFIHYCLSSQVGSPPLTVRIAIAQSVRASGS